MHEVKQYTHFVNHYYYYKYNMQPLPSQSYYSDIPAIIIIGIIIMFTIIVTIIINTFIYYHYLYSY